MNVLTLRMCVYYISVLVPGDSLCSYRGNPATRAGKAHSLRSYRGNLKNVCMYIKVS